MIRDTELIKNIKTKNITWDEFLKYENCPVQRNHIKRAEDKKTRIKLGELQSQHLCIATAELIKESYDPANNVTYSMGSKFVVDGHTRRQFWKNESSDFIPDSLISQHYEVKNIEDLRKLYYSYDNSSNTEQSSDLAYGACRYLGIELTNHKMYNVTGLTWAAYFYNNTKFPKNNGYDGKEMIPLFQEFSKEILFLDRIVWKLKYIRPQLITASILFLKNYNNDNAKTIITRIFKNSFVGPDDDGRYDGVTNLIEWLKNATKEDLVTNYHTIPKLTKLFLYWMDQQYLEDTQGKSRLDKKGRTETVLTKFSKSANTLFNV
jgi:hypothetical protein|tara:strand:- start:1847 stop:2806 length:960 start_codon:yes stop_codon:yes gene_type:complete